MQISKVNKYIPNIIKPQIMKGNTFILKKTKQNKKPK